MEGESIVTEQIRTLETQSDLAKTWSVLLASFMERQGVKKFETTLTDLERLMKSGQQLIAVETDDKIVITFE